jgi:hypothetical protein
MPEQLPAGDQARLSRSLYAWTDQPPHPTTDESRARIGFYCYTDSACSSDLVSQAIEPLILHRWWTVQ